MVVWKSLLTVGRPGSAEDKGQQLLDRRLEGDDSYWWILAGGVHVPGFGPYQEA